MGRVWDVIEVVVGDVDVVVDEEATIITGITNTEITKAKVKDKHKAKVVVVVEVSTRLIPLAREQDEEILLLLQLDILRKEVRVVTLTIRPLMFLLMHQVLIIRDIHLIGGALVYVVVEVTEG